MKVDFNKFSDVDVISSTEEKEITLSKDSQSMFFQMFTKNIYSNPIGSIVREITSNCFDSHIEANVKVPILIKKGLDNQTNSHYISFIDFGVGMSPTRINDVFSVMFTSTKRADNQQIGGFGLGSKVPLAYKRTTGHGVGEYDNSYSIITNYNGVKYSYLIYEGKQSPMITLLDYQTTTEHNGTEVRIPVLERDLNTFAKEMVRQLYYFENVIFEGFDDTHYDDTLSNQYQIVRGKSFLYRGTEYSSAMHVCLGRVAYPIDYNVLGLNSGDYYIPVAVKLEVGEINVTASREQLDYSEHTIKVLKNKLNVVKTEIREMLAKQYESIITLNDYFEVKNEFGKLKFPNGSVLSVNNLIKHTEIDYSNFKYSALKMPNDKQLFEFFFESKRYGKKTTSRYGRSANRFDGGYDSIKSQGNLLYVEGELVRKVAKQSYLKDTHGTYFVINKRNITDGYIRHEIAELFNVHVDKIIEDNGKINGFVQTLIEMQEEYWQIVKDNVENYDTIEVPVEYTVRKKRGVMSEELRKQYISAKLFGSWGKSKIKLSSLFDFNLPIFYGVQEDEDKLNTAYSLYKVLFDADTIVSRYNEYRNEFYRSENNSKKGIMFVMLSKSNVKYMQFCKNAIHIDQFYTRMLYRKADIIQTYFQTYSLIEKYNELTTLYRNENFTKIHALWGKKIKNVKTYMNSIMTSKNELGSYKQKLQKFFNIDNITMSDEQRKIARQIDEILELQKRNTNILYYINGYNIGSGNLDATLVDILSKVMVFK